MRPEFEHEWRERFEEFASLRDDDAGIAGWTASGLDARVRRFLDLFAEGAPAGTWLDAGCGAGTYTRILHERGNVVVGVDYSWPTLRKAKARAAGASLYLAADVRRLPFDDSAFDGVLCLGVLQALSESEPALRQLSRVTRAGGELWVDGLNASCVVHVVERWRRRLRGKPAHLRYESPWRVRRLLREVGLIDVDLHWMPIAPGGSPWLQRIFDAPPIARLFKWLPPLGLLFSHAFIVRARRPPGAAASSR